MFPGLRRIVGFLSSGQMNRRRYRADFENKMRTHAGRDSVQRRAMTLAELLLALTLAAGVMLATSQVVLQTARSITRIERKTQGQTEASIGLLRMRGELREATSITSLSTGSVTFSHPDVTGDGAMDVIAYSWNGTAGSALTREVNGGGAQALIDSVTLAKFTSITSLPTTEELLWGHVAYTPSIQTSLQELAVTNTTWGAQVFQAVNGSASYFRVTRVRLFMRPITAVGSVSVSIRSSPSGTPSAGFLEQVSRPIAQLNAAGGWEDFVFGSNSYLSPSAYYGVVIRCGSSGGSVGVKFDLITANAPASTFDAYRYTTNSGSSWLPVSGLVNRDMKCLVYGRWTNNGGNALSISTPRVTGIDFHLEGKADKSTLKLDSVVQCVNTPEIVQ